MPGFFEQMCQIMAETERKRPGSAVDPSELRTLFTDRPPEKAAAPQHETVAPHPETTPIPAAPAVPSTPATPSAGGNDYSAFTNLEELAAAMANCRNCPLCSYRKKVVPGEGPANARLMFIGEAPGADEDIQGRPFVGKAGMLLTKMINAMQFSREEVYITNIVKCRPPDNRTPTPEEAARCIGCLRRQIEIIRPEVIVLLGATAVKYLLNVTTGISRLRGRWLSYENIPVMATFHPAFLLRQESAKRETWNDLQQVMARFGKFHNRQQNSGQR